MGSLDKSNVKGNAADTNSLTPAFGINRIAVIGAGPSGLAAAKHLLAEGFSSSQIDIYEQQAQVGGVWNYSAIVSSQPLRVPQTDAHAAPDPPIYPEEPAEEKDEYDDYEFDSDEEACTAPGSGACSLPAAPRKEKRPAIFPNPMYEDLHTNIPHTLMRYSDLGFTADGKGKGTHEDCEIFPSRQVVQEYLLQYARDVRHLVRFSTQVTDVSLQTPPPETQGANSGQQPLIRDKWTVRSTNLLTDVSRTLHRKSAPPIPEDTAAHLGVGDKVRVVGPITHFLVGEKGVEVSSAPKSPTAEAEENTERISNIDAIVFCTGYLYTFPFISTSSLPPSTPPLITNGRRVHGLARHFIHTYHPTLVFPGLPIKIIPFPVAEAQAAVFSRLWSNRLPLPSHEELQAWEREDEEGKGFEGSKVEGKSFHTFPKGGDAKYINALHAWALRVRDGGGEKIVKGKEPPFWGDEELWQRSIYAQAKMQFEKTGRKAKTLQELGFRHE